MTERVVYVVTEMPDEETTWLIGAAASREGARQLAAESAARWGTLDEWRPVEGEEGVEGSAAWSGPTPTGPHCSGIYYITDVELRD